MDFVRRIATWQQQHGRHGLPWQNTRDPYRIWLSEIMLQQTQVATVIDYYHRFLDRFPTVQSLAGADQDTVMTYWAGLGYYARARNLHRCAQVIVHDWNGQFPPNAAMLATLPGIGRTTAAAIASFAYEERTPILDGNVKRIFARHFGIAGDPSQREVDTQLWAHAHAQLSNSVGTPAVDMRAYTQGLMDLGATVCIRRQPHCARCPIQNSCFACRQGCQDEFPTPQTRQPIPTRTTNMLILEQDQRILLEQRPAPGIWGGLWSLPEFHTHIAPTKACQALGATPQHIDALTPFLHTFTHFRLRVQPWHITTLSPPLLEANPPHVWVDATTVQQTALPAPVRTLIRNFFTQKSPILASSPA